MSLELRSRFEAIKAFYAANLDEIMSETSDEWGIDPYAWDHDAGIELTHIEWALWDDIRAVDIVVYPQFPVGRFFVDFGNPVAKIAIECDGKRWHQDAQKDADRQDALEAMGWRVYRISGRDCFTSTRESNDEDGRMVWSTSPARKFVEMIADRHPIRRGHGW